MLTRLSNTLQNAAYNLLYPLFGDFPRYLTGQLPTEASKRADADP